MSAQLASQPAPRAGGIPEITKPQASQPALGKQQQWRKKRDGKMDQVAFWKKPRFRRTPAVAVKHLEIVPLVFPRRPAHDGLRIIPKDLPDLVQLKCKQRI